MRVTEALFGFDWRKTGPLALVARGRRRLGSLPSWARAIGAIGAILAIGGALYVGVPIPVWAWLIAFAALAGGAIMVLPARNVVDELQSEDDEILEELHPVEGDRATRTLSQDRWANLTVVDYSGKKRDRSYLTEVSRLVEDGENGEQRYRTAYEVDAYWPESNTALASYMAGASNADLRRFERAVFVVKEKLSTEADRSLEEIVQAPEARRKAASSAVNSIIQSAEGVEAPGDTSIIDELEELRQEAEDSVDDVLSDRGIGDLSKQFREESDDSEKDAESVAITIDNQTDNGGDDE